MTRIAALSTLVLLALAACGPSEEIPTTTCQAGELVCGSNCCKAGEACNAASGSCEPACTPSCRGRECGSDGCGGTCGAGCESGFLCQEETGICYRCTPKCDGKTCGDDGCGGTCGSCPSGTTCQGGSCGVCQPQCNGRQCGPDGCGGQCGTCASGACDPSGRCVECVNHSDCAGSANGNRCSPDRRCVACLTNTDCNPDGSITCDTTTNRCEVACTGDADCTGAPGAPRCDTARGECVACLGSGDCGGTTPSCDPSTAACVVCASDSDCSSSGRGNRCLNKQACVQCTSSADCGGGACNPTTNTCGECFSDTDCAGNPTKKFCDTAQNLCVGCKSDQNCGGAAPGCHPTTKTCVGCTSDAHCPGQRCNTTLNACVECLGNSDCPGGFCQVDHCISNSAGGDTCASPGILDLSSGSVTVNGLLALANHDVTGSCGGSGRDVVYQFTLTSTKDVTIRLEALASGMRPVVYLQTACAGGSGSLACAASSGESVLTIRRDGLTAGTYYVWVDSTAGFTQEQYSLTVTAAEPPPPMPGDTCGNAIPITFNSAGNATTSGTTVGAKPDYQSVACVSSGADLVYSFTTQFPGLISAQIFSLGSGYTPAIYLQTRCPATSSGDEVRCQSATSPGGSAGITYSNAPAGTYYLVVDGAGGSEGAFDLQVSIPTSAPVNTGESCSDPIPITLVGGVGTVSGTTVGKAHDATDSVCSHASSPDVVYSFVNPVKQAVQVNLKNHTPSWRPAIYMQTACGTPATRVGCNRMTVAGKDLLLLLDEVPAGTIYLWIDSYTGSSSSPVSATTGSYDLTVRAGVPTIGTGGESCSAPTPVVLTEGVAIGKAKLTTSNLDSNVASCASGGRDVVYSVDVPSGVELFYAYVEGSGSVRWDPAVNVTRGTTCSTATAITNGCSAEPGDPIFQNTHGYGYVEVANPPAGRYFVWVEGATSSQVGDYYIEIWAR